MRFLAIAILLIPVGARAQAPQEAPASASASAVSPPPADEVVPNDRAKPLASSNQTGRVLSKNEAYNSGRAADGRVGVRLGNDVSYRVTGN
jgi:hypothetical protein